MLTRREDQILELVSHGLSAKQIGDRLFVSPETVRKTISNTKEKLQLHTSAELASYYWCNKFGSSYYEVRKLILVIPCIIIMTIGGVSSVRRARIRAFSPIRSKTRIEMKYHRESTGNLNIVV